MTAVDSIINLPPQARAPQNFGAGRKGEACAENAACNKKEFTAALTETPRQKEEPPVKTEQAAKTAETAKPEHPQDTAQDIVVKDTDVKGTAIEALLEKLAQGTEIDPALLEQAQAGDTDALKEILLSLGIETEGLGLENIAANDPQGQIVAALAQLLQAQNARPQTPAAQTPPTGIQLSQPAALLLAQEEQQTPQTQQAVQAKDGDAAKEQPRPAPAQQINAQQQAQPQQQQVQQQTPAQQQAANAGQTGTNAFGDGSGFAGDSPDGGFPQQGAGTQAGPDGQSLLGQDGKLAQQSGLPQFATAKAAGSFQSPAMHKVFLTMQRNAADRIQQMTLQLEPAAMGRVAVTMIFGKEGAMKAHLLVEKPETYQMLSKDSQALEKALKEAGIDLGDNALSFDLASGQDQFEKAEAERDSGQKFHFYMQGEDGDMTAAEQAAGMMNAAHANDYVLKKDSVNILI
ncbi:MAG: flagellar hook-length control protein FliK [Pseudomonadota bacterium]|nr:flagellar hook-length control protein FliK [Pseudomonadota bacterium]QKK05311.1 MAG: flagellar hook-length control protein FliK [Pseudomonadota bacterium]